MSIEVMTAVWDYSTAYGGDLLIMLAIANFADIYGRAYPSVATLAQRGRMTERNAQYCIQNLEALGELKVERNAGPHGTHVYRIILAGAKFSGCKVFTHRKKGKRNKELTPVGEKIADENFSGVQSFQTETHFTGGVKPISPEPSVDPSVEEKTTTSSTDLAQDTAQSGEDIPAPRVKKVPKSQEPGELHPTVVKAVESLVVQKFHCLAQPTKQNENFWDSQIALVEEAGIISFVRCLKEVDAYWSGNPQKLALKADGLRRQMHRGIEIALEKAQRNLKGIPHHG